ncbi:putative tumor differentially expressed protein [Paragonimus heterotremus]|uniref:Putative tumor differentially expressed protein n=1 Tax=Paragonimus heterotremus TaxID=100268 RepID=A0A8J4SQT7_9TREM|nr:putative tumor differentially expressed protein [Paragonimus heterotremus]
MTDAGFFKGTSAEQDARFADKKKKLMKTMKFGDNLSQKVDMTRINLDCIRPWVAKRITELLNFEDEVVCNYVLNQLEERHPDPKEIQINITGFLNSKNARIFLTELWDLLLSAMENPDGVPGVFLEAKKTEILRRQEEEQRMQLELRRKEEELRLKGSNLTVARASITGGPNQTSAGLPGTQIQRTTSFVEAANSTTTSQVACSEDVKAFSRRRSRSSASSTSSPHHPRQDNLRKEKVDSLSRSRRNNRHHHRRRSSNSSASSGLEDHAHAKSGYRETRRRHRSKSEDTDGRKLNQRPVPDSDWRKDLMAGRRRSPPEMPENSYYGYEKRRKERRSSGERYREHHRREGSGSRRLSPANELHNEFTYRDHRESRHRTDYRDVEHISRHQEHRKRRHESQSTCHKEVVLNLSAGRTDGFLSHPQPVKESFRVLPTRDKEPKTEKRSLRSVEQPPKCSNVRRRTPSPSPEGPSLPPNDDSSKKVVEQDVSSSSSDSETEDSDDSSSDDDSGSSASSSSSAESSDSGESELNDQQPLSKAGERTPEGPALPPAIVTGEPEGPVLPVSADLQEWTDNLRSAKKNSVVSSSDTESSGDSSGSRSSESDSGTSDSSVDEPPVHKAIKFTSTKQVHVLGGSAYAVIRDERRRSTHNVPREDHKNAKDPKSVCIKDQREEDAEEDLRRRALASLIRASGDGRAASSLSP